MRREVPRGGNLTVREMLEDEEGWGGEDDMVEINWEDVISEEEGEELIREDTDEEEEVEDGNHSFQPPVDDAAFMLLGHTRSVFCCAFHPSDKYAITGGEDDVAILWKLSTHKPVSVLSHYQDSVCEVGFSFDGTFVAIADMLGNIEVYRTDQDLMLTKVWSERIEEVQWMEWHKQAHVLLAGGLGSNVYMWKIPSGECKVFSGEGSSPTGTFMPDGKRALVAYRNGSVRLFDLMTGEVLCSYKNKDWNMDEIISLAVHPMTNLAVVGDFSGNIALFTTFTPSKIVKEYNFSAVGVDQNGGNSNLCCIENLMFTQDPDVSSLLVSTSRGLFIYDYVKQAVKKYIDISPGVTKMVALGDKDMFAIGTTSGTVALADVKQGVVTKTLSGHSDTILSLALSSDKRSLLTTSDDTSIRLFHLTERMETT